jgi:hypothetical protein
MYDYIHSINSENTNIILYMELNFNIVQFEFIF